jgi:hypothetical protein
MIEARRIPAKGGLCLVYLEPDHLKVAEIVNRGQGCGLLSAPEKWTSVDEQHLSEIQGSGKSYGRNFPGENAQG